MINKKIIDEFSEQIEMLKDEKRFDSYADTLQYALENNIYNTIPLTFSNVGQFLNKSVKEKLLIEYSRKGCIKDEYKKTNKNVLF
jgi:hypothetical protein